MTHYKRYLTGGGNSREAWDQNDAYEEEERRRQEESELEKEREYEATLSPEELKAKRQKEYYEYMARPMISGPSRLSKKDHRKIERKEKRKSFWKKIGLKLGLAGLLLTSGCNSNTKEPEQKQISMPEMPRVEYHLARKYLEDLEELRYEHVAESNTDVRGTWYKHGRSGGWYGPNNEWGFGWYYLRQYGKTVIGTYEPELNNRGRPNRNPKVKGYVDGDYVFLGFIAKDGNINYSISGKVNNDTIEYAEQGLSSYKRILKRTDKKISTRKTPWQKQEK